ncbi:outer membrane beta-barrel protein [Bacteroidota bacterium]
MLKTFANKLFSRIAFSFLLFLITLGANAQIQGIRGWVADSASNKVILGAHVLLTRPSDGLSITSVTGSKGGFYLNPPAGTKYALNISYVGYGNFIKEIVFDGGLLDLDTIRIAVNDKVLDEVEISAQILPVEQKGDTTIYNAESYKILPDASAEDMIQKMPGIMVEDNKVEAQGEEVKEVHVDGKEFFGQDPMMALRNIPAEVIEKIEVFDKLSEQAQFTGFDDGNTTKTINIITRAQYRNGQFGKLYGGIGTDERYKIGGSVNFFNEDQRISIIGQSNNVNEQNFSTQDLLGVIGTNTRARGMGFRPGGGGRPRGGMGGGRIGGGPGGMMRGLGMSSIDNFLVGKQNGISTTHALGINYQDDWGENWEVTASYFFNRNGNDTKQYTSSEYFLPDNENQFYEEALLSNSENGNHRFNLRLNWNIDSSNSLLFLPRLNVQMNKSDIDITGATTQSGELLSETNNSTDTDIGGYDFNNIILYRHRFKKQGRTISVAANTGLNGKEADSYMNAENLYYTGMSADNDTIRQFTNSLIDGYKLSSNFVYTEPITQKGMLQMSYNIYYSDQNSDKETNHYNETSLDYTDLDTLLSNSFQNQYLTNRIGAGYRHRGEKYFLMAGASYQFADLRNVQSFPNEADLDYSFRNILPVAIFNYQFSHQKNLRLIYRTMTRQPSVEQLQPVVDNSNPIRLSVGNPTLDQQAQNIIVARYSLTDFMSAKTFFLMFSGGYTNDYITNATYITSNDTIVYDVDIPAGVQLSRPVNLERQWNVRSLITYGFPVSLIKSILNLNLMANYTETPGLINEVINHSRSTDFTFSAVLSSNISDKLDFTLSTSTRLNNTINTNQGELNNRYLNHRTRFKIDWIIWKSITFRNNISHQFYEGLSEGFNENYMIWNMSLGKKVFKNERGEIAIMVFDLLDENTSLVRNITESSIEDVRTNPLQRYLMMTFTYNLRNFGKGISQSAPQQDFNRRRMF